jgi:ATP-dependent Clp protease protease subunit
MNTPPPKEIFFTFVGPIDAHAAGRIISHCNLAHNKGVETVHLLVQSSGGSIDDGIAVYNYLANLPLKVVTYNEGSVQSIAVLVYLAGKHRLCAANASFFLHKTTMPSVGDLPEEVLRARADAAKVYDQRTEAILRPRVTMPEEKWALRDKLGLTINAQEAKQYGFAHEIGHFSIAKGCEVFGI